MPTISVIIVNYNAGELLRRCLDDLLAQDYTDFEVLLVDNASQDNSLESLPEDARITLLQLDQNTGFAKANNLAAQQAKGTWLALLNPDAFPRKDWLSSLISATEQFPRAVMFGSTQLNADDPQRLDGTGDMVTVLGVPYRSHYGKPVACLPDTGEVFAPCAAAALYRADVFRAAGGFDEQLFCYCEDVDLAFRLRLMGQHCIQVKDAVVYHKGSAITAQVSDFARFYGMRNRLWVWWANMPLPLLVALMPCSMVFEVMWAAYATLRGHGRCHIRAVIAAIQGIPQVVAKRQKVQAQRRISSWQLAKMLVWSPLALLQRKQKQL